MGARPRTLAGNAEVAFLLYFFDAGFFPMRADIFLFALRAARIPGKWCAGLGVLVPLYRLL